MTAKNKFAKSWDISKDWLKASLVALLLINCISCSNQSIKANSNSKAVQWEARMLIRDIEKSKSHILNLDLIATQEQQIRIEATTTMGFSVASFAVDKNVVSYYLSSNKKYYKGAVGAQAMQALVGLNIEPHDFIDFIFDQIPGNAAWACQKNTNQELKRCLHKRENLEVLWSKRDTLSKSIEIKSDKASIQLALSSYSEPKNLEANTFLVNKP